ncbi:MAG: hypothetical protein ACRC62_04680 [Microcoleus sp.]
MEEAIEIEYRPLDWAIAKLLPENPKLHDIEALIESFELYGFRDAPEYDATADAIVAGNGRVQALAQMRSAGLPPPKRIKLDASGNWHLPVQVGADASSEAEAIAYSIDNNALPLLGGGFSPLDLSRLYDPDQYQEMLDRLAAEEFLPVAIDTESLEALRAIADGDAQPPQPRSRRSSKTPPEESGLGGNSDRSPIERVCVCPECGHSFYQQI